MAIWNRLQERIKPRRFVRDKVMPKRRNFLGLVAFVVSRVVVGAEKPAVLVVASQTDGS